MMMLLGRIDWTWREDGCARRRGGTFSDAPSCAGVTLRDDLDTVLARLDAVGLRQVAYVDLSRAEFGIPVARMIVPGLEGPWTPAGGDYTPGARARAVRMVSAVVFLGPTLPMQDAAALLDATFLPPARQGDVFRAVRAYRPRAIGLIDGVFLDVPAVWHREILWALSRGHRMCSVPHRWARCVQRNWRRSACVVLE